MINVGYESKDRLEYTFLLSKWIDQIFQVIYSPIDDTKTYPCSGLKVKKAVQGIMALYHFLPPSTKRRLEKEMKEFRKECSYYVRYLFLHLGKKFETYLICIPEKMLEDPPEKLKVIMKNSLIENRLAEWIENNLHKPILEKCMEMMDRILEELDKDGFLIKKTRDIDNVGFKPPEGWK